MIHIGDTSRYPCTSKPLSIWTIRGTLEFSGKMNFYNGTYVYVAEGAVLKFGSHGTFVGSDTKIICRESIEIGDSVEITWNCQIYDTSFHYISKDGQDPQKLTKSIVIHDHTWIGNNSTITKGAEIPSYSIVASHSLINKDYSAKEENCMFAGMPGTVMPNHYHRVWDYKQEQVLDEKYRYKRFKL